MPWTVELPIVNYVTQILDFRLRAERLQLVKRIKGVETQLRAVGVDTTPLREIRTALTAVPTIEIDPLQQLTPQPKPKYDDPIQHLAVRQHPASVF